MNRKNKLAPSITALYCRLSIEDGRENESMSISNQKALLRDFAEKNGLLDYEFYVDDGYTGRNFNRPSFQRMIADIEAGKVKCVITKDLSRLGRNYMGNILNDRRVCYYDYERSSISEQRTRDITQW